MDRFRAAIFLIERLERLSADSTYAHLASGIRGSLLRFIDQTEQKPDPDSPAHSNTQEHPIDFVIHLGFKILIEAAREIPDPQEHLLLAKGEF